MLLLYLGDFTFSALPGERRYPTFPSIHSQARRECGIETERRQNVLRKKESIKERASIVCTIDGNQAV